MFDVNIEDAVSLVFEDAEDGFKEFLGVVGVDNEPSVFDEERFEVEVAHESIVVFVDGFKVEFCGCCGE